MIDTNKIKAIRAKAHTNENMSGCSQAVLAALQEGLDIGNVQSLKAATAFAGGMARRGESCGALVGALMALGLEKEEKSSRTRLNSSRPSQKVTRFATSFCAASRKSGL